MDQAQIEIILVASLVSISCSLVGVFLVLRKMAMMSDAITHTVLLGIVIAFMITKQVNSIWLMIGALLAGLLTVFLVESLTRTSLLSEDSAIGVVYPALFSMAIILISLFTHHVHLDTDAVLLGELAFVPLDRMLFFGFDICSALLTSSIILLIDVLVVIILFKELKLSSFDPLLAMTLGFSPILLNYLIMALVSITAVSAFNVTGSILVISLMIGPSITAYLLTHQLKKMILLSLLIAVSNAVIGYGIANVFDVSIAGCIAVVTGLSFTIAFLFSKKQGYLYRLMKRNQQQKQLECFTMLLIIDNLSMKLSPLIKITDLQQLIHVSKYRFNRYLNQLTRQELIIKHSFSLKLTTKGKEYIKQKHKLFLSN